MQPTISIIVPCLNEERRIRYLLDAIISQTYPQALLEVIIANGDSKDRTLEVISTFKQEHPELSLQVIQNSVGSIPAALNFAIKASHGEVILRLDAHSAPYPDYVEKCVNALESGKGENVGGVWEIRPGADTYSARSIAKAAAHPLGVGDALYRHTSTAAEVDTVPFGCYRRELVDRVGGYDETLLANEDYEFNARIRKSGGKIWLEPGIRSVYYARSSYLALAQQYFRYGFWKYKMLSRYPKTLRWRQALPPIFVAELILSLLLSPFYHFLIGLLIFEILAYLGILIIASLKLAFSGKEYFLIIGLPLAIISMHIAWGTGFLVSIFSPTKRA